MTNASQKPCVANKNGTHGVAILNPLFVTKFVKGPLKERERVGSPYLFPLEENDGFTHKEKKHKRSRYPDGKRYLGDSCDNKCICCNANGIEYPHIKAQCCEAAKRIKGSDLEKDYYDENNTPVPDDLRFPKVSECRVNIGSSGLSID